MALLDEGQSGEELAYSTGLSGGALTTPLANRGLEGGTAAAHTAGYSVKGILTVGMWNQMITALTNVLLQTTGALDTAKVVDLTTAQTLTNKKLSDSTTTIVDVSDATKAVKFDVAGTASVTGIIATAFTTAKTVTLPDATDTLVGKATTDTLSNKRMTRRVVATTQSATPTINTDNTDVSHITGLAQAITSMTTNLSGTPVNGDSLIISITDNGTARAITWGASFESSGNATLPTITVLSVRLDVGFLWNTVTSKWRCVAVA